MIVGCEQKFTARLISCEQKFTAKFTARRHYVRLLPFSRALPYQFATGVLSRWIRQRQQRRVLGLSQGALVALMAPNSCPVVMPVLYVLPAVSQPSLLIPFYPHYCALWLLR